MPRAAKVNYDEFVPHSRNGRTCWQRRELTNAIFLDPHGASRTIGIIYCEDPFYLTGSFFIIKNRYQVAPTLRGQRRGSFARTIWTEVISREGIFGWIATPQSSRIAPSKLDDAETSKIIDRLISYFERHDLNGSDII